jgi:prepilin-type N-terminal cleavage/methylation domain-containing protein
MNPRRSLPRASRGFTLIEMLVALAITLIMMGAVVTLFGVITESVSGSRSAIEMSDRLRGARNQLQLDLQGATATMRPPLRPENDEGYLEIIEGPINDGTFVQPPLTAPPLFGDVDDVLMLTTRSRGAPFAGKLNGVVVTSPVAEVVYFLVQNGPVIDATTSTRLCTLYRRVFLIVPGVGPIVGFDDEFYDANDISVHYIESGTASRLIPNTLGDLTKRENRFAHYGDTTVNYGDFPFPVDLFAIPPNVPPPPPPPSLPEPTNWPTTTTPEHPKESAFIYPAEHLRTGDDVLLTNVLAFDVQVWDPLAPVFVSNGVAVEPRDPGWVGLAPTAPPVGFGAYVDLGYGIGVTYTPPSGTPNPVFIGAPQSKSGLAAPPAIYDTWSLHYENDGLDQDNFLGPDAGTNGLDDDTNGVVDDIGEYDTLPPYSAPLRGIRVTIRVYEPDSQQVREAVVIQDFLPD